MIDSVTIFRHMLYIGYLDRSCVHWLGYMFAYTMVDLHYILDLIRYYLTIIIILCRVKRLHYVFDMRSNLHFLLLSHIASKGNMIPFFCFQTFSSTVEEKAKWVFNKLKGNTIFYYSQ